MQLANKYVVPACFFVLTLFMISSCNIIAGSKNKLTRDSLLSSAPVLTPDEFIRFTHIEAGFELQAVAAEPEVITPVSMIFDDSSRIWAVEMTSFMTDAEGHNEDTPNGRIVILEDADKDGYFETRKLFLDSLVLPRAIAFVDKGILVAAPPNLWYYSIKDDRPFGKQLVDGKYTEGNNVEAQSNGLFRATDNWIYNAASNKRYRKSDTSWIIEKTHFRGQWGITQDDDGRLFYNNNSQNLLGDYFLPGLGSGNPNLTRVSGFNERIVEDNTTFPSRPTPGINRGYLKTEVDDSVRLKKFTAACGPVLYRGDLFDTGYYQNAFVAEPAGNLIKRNILSFTPAGVTGTQAYTHKEFIRSDDERFRPVNLYNGPDGALYIVDMYRGVIQYKLMLTKYLASEIEKRKLDKPINCGRIYRVVPKGLKAEHFEMPESPKELIGVFKSKNSWRRERAQQLLVESKPAEIIKPLKEMLHSNGDFTEFIHSLWTLKGMEAISNDELMALILQETDSRRLNQLIAAMDKIDPATNRKKFVEKIESLIADSTVAPYIAFKCYLFDGLGEQVSTMLQHQLLFTYPNSTIIAQAIISNAYQKEAALLNRLKRLKNLPPQAAIFQELDKVLEYIDNYESKIAKASYMKKYGRGIWLFSSACQSCHGSDGAGIKNLAPPLNNSEWVTGNKDNLISIVLYGLTGPVSVNSKRYEVPDVSGEMPGIINNPEFVESDLALLLSYIRNNWSNKASDIQPEDIQRVKSKWGNRMKPFTAAELQQNSEK